MLQVVAFLNPSNNTDIIDLYDKALDIKPAIEAAVN